MWDLQDKIEMGLYCAAGCVICSPVVALLYFTAKFNGMF